jgi:hypothetical protein
MNKKDKDQQEAIWELLATEVTYIHKISIVKKVGSCLHLQRDAQMYDYFSCIRILLAQDFVCQTYIFQRKISGIFRFCPKYGTK